MKPLLVMCLGVSLVGSAPLFAADDKEQEVADLAARLAGSDYKAASRASERLVKIGAPAVPALKKLLDDNAAHVLAAETLGKIGPDASDALSGLVEGLKKVGEPEYSAAATIAMGKIGAAAVPYLQSVLKEETDEKVLANASLVLRQIGPDAKDAVPELIEVVKKGKPPQAVEALGRIGPKAKAAVPVLAEALKGKGSGSDPMRVRAAIALGQIGPDAKEAVPALADALSGPPPLRFHAATSLGQIGPNADKAVVALIDLLKDEKAGPGRALAAQALGEIGPGAKDALRTLKELTGNKDGNLGTAATKAVEKIEKK
jgi:HEAT repeat protein